MDLAAAIQWTIPAFGVIAVLFALYLARDVLARDQGSEAMQDVASTIFEGAVAFIRRQYTTIALLALVASVIIGGVIAVVEGQNVADTSVYGLECGIRTGVAFLVGAACSMAAGIIGMYISVRSNGRAASAAQRSLVEAVQVAMRGGAVSGFLVVSLSLLGVFLMFVAFGGVDNPAEAPFLIVGYGFGASFVALFAQLGGGITESNEGDFFVRLKPLPRRPIKAVMAEVRQRVEHEVPGLDIDLAQLMEDLIGDLTAVPQPVEIKLFDPDSAALLATAPKIAKAIATIPGIVDVRDGIVQAGDAISIRIDRDKAALEGVSPQSVTRQLKTYYTGLVTTQVLQGIKLVVIRAWVPGSIRHRLASLNHLWLRAPDGHRFPLRRIAAMRILTGQPQIVRDDMKRMVAVTARISGRDMGSTLRDVKRVLKKPGLLPPSMYDELGGLYHQQQIAFKGMMIVFAAATALVFLLLLYLFIWRIVRTAARELRRPHEDSMIISPAAAVAMVVVVGKEERASRRPLRGGAGHVPGAGGDDPGQCHRAEPLEWLCGHQCAGL